MGADKTSHNKNFLFLVKGAEKWHPRKAEKFETIISILVINHIKRILWHHSHHASIVQVGSLDFTLTRMRLQSTKYRARIFIPT